MIETAKKKKKIKKQQLTLPIPLIFQEYLAGKVRTIMMLRYLRMRRYSKLEVRRYMKWDVGTTKYKQFELSNEKEKCDAVINEVR